MINLNKVYNDFGDTLPEASVFFNSQKNEITRKILCKEYKTESAYKAFSLFSVDYAEFVAKLKASITKKDVKKDEAK